MSSSSSNSTPFRAFDHLSTTEQRFPTRVGVQAFKALVKDDGSRTLRDGDVGWRAPLPSGDMAQMTRHRSWSITETHSTPVDATRTHSAYHYSATRKEVFALKPSKATGVRASHESGNNL
jgi:hypothetical protein